MSPPTKKALDFLCVCGVAFPNQREFGGREGREMDVVTRVTSLLLWLR
jgi:hypothetical protein